MSRDHSERSTYTSVSFLLTLIEFVHPSTTCVVTSDTKFYPDRSAFPLEQCLGVGEVLEENHAVSGTHVALAQSLSFLKMDVTKRLTLELTKSQVDYWRRSRIWRWSRADERHITHDECVCTQQHFGNNMSLLVQGVETPPSFSADVSSRLRPAVRCGLLGCLGNTDENSRPFSSLEWFHFFSAKYKPVCLLFTQRKFT